jgi:hypothetical protein
VRSKSRTERVVDLHEAGTLEAVSVYVMHERPHELKPDISSVDAFKHTLLTARSIVYADPAKGGASGVYFARVLDRLGIAEQMKGKTILVPGAQAAEVVARGEAELGVAQGSEIVPVAGAQLVGPLPGELASMTVFTAGIDAPSKSPEAAKTLIEFLTGPEAASRFKSKGFEPGQAAPSAGSQAVPRTKISRPSSTDESAQAALPLSGLNRPRCQPHGARAPNRGTVA